MSNELVDVTRRATLTIAKDAAVSGAFKFAGNTTGMLIAPDAWTDANIGFYVCDTETGTYVILRDDAGTPVQISGVATAAARAYALPAKLSGAFWVKVWSKHKTAGTETDVTQAAARTLGVMAQ